MGSFVWILLFFGLFAQIQAQFQLRTGSSLIQTNAVQVRDPKLKVDDSPESRLAEATSRFALLFLNNVGSSKGNVFYSPYSLQILLSMLYLGARTKSEQELKQALGYQVVGLNGDEAHLAMKSIGDSLQRKGAQQEGQHVLDVANALLLQVGSKILPNYQQKLQTFYDAEMHVVDFKQHGDLIKQWANNWVKWKTDGKIESIVDQPLPGDTKMFLMNAVYFKGTWLYKFDEQLTRNLKFYNGGQKENVKQIKFMLQSLKVPFADLPDLNVKAVELPYAGSDITMMILLPRERDGLGRLQTSLTSSTLRYIESKLRKKEVALQLPKFKLEQGFDLQQILERMGIKGIFDVPSADLTGIDGTGNLYVSKAIHKAAVEVNEEGTKASATSVAATSVRTSVVHIEYFTAEHPFLFLIRDRRTGLVLFLGRVSEL